MSANRKFGSNVPVRRGRTASSSSQKTNNHSNKKDKINAQRVVEEEEGKELYFTEDYGELESMVPQLIQDEVAGAKTTKKYEALMNSVLSQEKRAMHHQLLAEHHGQSNNDKTRQNGCLVRPQRILSQKRFHSSIDRNNMKNNTNALFQQQEKLLTTIVNNQSQNKKNSISSNNNNNNDDDDSPAGASAVSKMIKKMMDSAYGHGTNGIRVVNGKLKTLVVSWLGALEGSHLGHLLRSEYFGTLNTNNGSASASSVLAEPASRRALCCVAVRFNKGYADWASASSSSHSASQQQQTVAPPPSSAFFENLTPFQVVGCLSMDEPILELTFPDGDEEGCAGVGTEVAVFYTPGLNLGIKNTNIYAKNNNDSNNTKQDVAVATAAPSSSAAKAKITGFQEVINPLLTASGELRCSLCVELTYTSVDVASNPKRQQTLKVQEASLIPHDDNNWIPLRSWVAHQIIQRKRKQLQEKEQEQQNENEEEATIPSSTLKRNHNSDAAVSSDVEAKKSSSLPHHHQQQQRLTSPLFGAMKTTNNLAAKMTSRTKEERDGRGVPSSGLDYDSNDDDDDVDSGVDDDDDDDLDVVDLKKFKLTNSKPGTDGTS